MMVLYSFIPLPAGGSRLSATRADGVLEGHRSLMWQLDINGNWTFVYI